MDEIEKCRIRLGYWIDHNEDHLKGYVQVTEILEKEGLATVAETVRKGIRLVEAANREFTDALNLLPGAGTNEQPGTEKSDAHGHSHSHGHSHAHTHDHSHAHSHSHEHEHSHGDSHEHSHEDLHEHSTEHSHDHRHDSEPSDSSRGK